MLFNSPAAWGGISAKVLGSCFCFLQFTLKKGPKRCGNPPKEGLPLFPHREGLQVPRQTLFNFDRPPRHFLPWVKYGATYFWITGSQPPRVVHGQLQVCFGLEINAQIRLFWVGNLGDKGRTSVMGFPLPEFPPTAFWIQVNRGREVSFGPWMKQIPKTQPLRERQDFPSRF